MEDLECTREIRWYIHNYSTYNTVSNPIQCEAGLHDGVAGLLKATERKGGAGPVAAFGSL